MKTSGESVVILTSELYSSLVNHYGISKMISYLSACIIVLCIVYLVAVVKSKQVRQLGDLRQEIRSTMMPVRKVL